uniref:Large ribosomal subunit protein uL4c n=1 Tax=Liagoropsis maxima TaxID=1653392 RepID=A0A1G4NVX0_9FLOR|nr:Ribosomal protein L4 [Liagoropsis maxima]SCW22818.1 Ribosomal protein L4 [Liagoropsis maxima]
MAIEKTIQYSIYKSGLNTNTSKEVTLQSCARNGSYIVHRSLIAQMSEKRQGTSCTKTRSQVQGGGRKPWKQKGTGKARAGSIRSPLWRGGGVIFGPKPKQYKKKINIKEKQLAIRQALINRANQTILIDAIDINLEYPKTKIISKKLKQININTKEKVLIIVSNKNLNLYLATRNLSNIELLQANHLNILSLLKAQKIIITKEGLSIIDEVYNG